VVFFPALAYLLGSIPSGVLMARALGLQDPRAAGSGNIGAANLTRLGGKKAGVLTFLLDFLKGFLPVLAARIYGPPDPTTAYLTALLAVTGHCYSVFLGFRGGKGVATTAGAFFPLAPIAMVAALFAWALGFYSFKVTSLAAMMALLALLGALLVIGNPGGLFLAALLTCLMVVRRHLANLNDLLSAKERRF
jgi:glycerol-3-phosphate acyltransferase PlsY